MDAASIYLCAVCTVVAIACIATVAIAVEMMNRQRHYFVDISDSLKPSLSSYGTEKAKITEAFIMGQLEQPSSFMTLVRERPVEPVIEKFELVPGSVKERPREI